MQIIKDIVHPAIPEHTEKVKASICDFCGKERKTVKCVICQRDACYTFYTSGENARCARQDPNCFDDYPDDYCPICYGLRFEKYKDEEHMIELDYELAQDRLIQKVRKESLESEVKHEVTT